MQTSVPMPEANCDADRPATPLWPVWVMSLGCVALLIRQSILLFASPKGHDQAWYLLAGERLLQGARPYGPLIMDPNPPFIMWLSVVPVALSRLIHTSTATALRAFVLGLVLASTLWCVRIVRRSHTPGPYLPFLVGYAALFVEFNTGLYDFGQREHFVTIFVLPFLLFSVLEPVPRLCTLERAALGVAAGLGFCCKPQQVIVLIGLVVFLALYHRSVRILLRPELVAVFLVLVLYVGVVLVVTPAYFKQVVPLLLNIYWAYGPNTTYDLLRSERNLLFLAACFVAGWAGLRQSFPVPVAPLAILLCGLCALLAYAVQHTGWQYQQLPAHALITFAILFAIAMVLARCLQDYVAGTRSVAVPLLLVAAALYVAKANVIEPFMKPDGKSPMEMLFRTMPKPSTVFVFSTSDVPFARAYYAGLEWGSRYGFATMVPAVVQNEQSAPRPAGFHEIPRQTLVTIAAKQRTDVTEDLERWKPEVIVVDDCTLGTCQGLKGIRFDWIEWFQRDPEFARVWSHYKPQPNPYHLDMYVRVP